METTILQLGSLYCPSSCLSMSVCNSVSLFLLNITVVLSNGYNHPSTELKLKYQNSSVFHMRNQCHLLQSPHPITHPRPQTYPFSSRFSTSAVSHPRSFPTDSGSTSTSICWMRVLVPKHPAVPQQWSLRGDTATSVASCRRHGRFL